jgi:hypothetical protein
MCRNRVGTLVWAMGAASCMTIYCVGSDHQPTSDLGVFFDLIFLTQWRASPCWILLYYVLWSTLTILGKQGGKRNELHRRAGTHQTTTHSESCNAHMTWYTHPFQPHADHSTPPRHHSRHARIHVRHALRTLHVTQLTWSMAIYESMNHGRRRWTHTQYVLGS